MTDEIESKEIVHWPVADQHPDFHRFTEIGQIFHDKYNFNNKKTWNNPPICKASSEENGTGQYPVWKPTQKLRQGDFR